MPSRKISSTSTECAAAPLMRAAVRTGARLPRARCESPRSSSPARARSSSTAGGTTAPGSNAAYQSITARLAWCSTSGAMGRLRYSSANRAKRSTTYTYSTSAPIARTRFAHFSVPTWDEHPSQRFSIHCQQGRLQLDAVPEILHPEILVRTVLIVVVIGDGNLDRVRPEYVDDHVERNAAARSRLQHDGAAHAARRRDEFLRGGEVHLRAHRIVAACLDGDLRDPRMGEARLLVGIGVDDVVALLADVRKDARDLPLLGHPSHQAKIDRRGRGGRNGVDRLAARLPARHAADVERRQTGSQAVNAIPST